MTANEQHEYVPHEWREMAVGTRDEWQALAAARLATLERTEAALAHMRAEANNMAEAAREANERLVEVGKELALLREDAAEYAEELLALWTWRETVPRYQSSLADLRAFIARCKGVA